jgi:hypothetical protein
MRPALDAVKEYLEAKRIRYEATAAGSIRFSILIPTPAVAEMPNRLVSCAVSIPRSGARTLQLSAMVMAVELSTELLAPVTSFFMKYQSERLKAGRIVIHEDGAIFYNQTQFLCSGASMDGNAVASMITTAILEMAAIFMVKDEFVMILPPMVTPRFGVA